MSPFHASDPASGVPGPITLPLSGELIQDTLRALEAKFFVDSDGDIGGFWPDCRIYFLTEGSQEEIYVIRGYLDRKYALEFKPHLLEVLDEWNRTYRWPKAYTKTDDDGVVRICTECEIDCEPGITRELFELTTRCWVGTTCQFVEWLEQQL